MRTKRTAAGALALGAALFGWWSCSGEPSAEEPDGGGTDAGGAAGSGGGGGSGGLPAGGSGGSGGTGGSAGWGAYPKWEATTAVVDGCPIERLVNAKEVRVFDWEPCEWSPNDCEQAVFNPQLLAVGDGWNAEGFIRTSVVHDDGQVVRVGLSISSATTERSVYTLEGGAGLDGFRVKIGTDCYMSAASVWGDRFAVKVRQDGKERNSGLVGRLGDPAQPTAFQHTSQPAGGSQGYVLGSERWVWWWAPAYAYTSVSALDGSDYVHFVSTSPPSPLVYVGSPLTTGKSFVFQAFEGDDAGIAHGKIMWSDGVAAPQTYLEPADPNDDFGSPMYAHTHMAFMRGVNRKDINKYDSTELWASAYSEDPSKLAPSLLAKLPYQSMNDGVGGWGRIAIPFLATGGLDFSVRNLMDGTERTFFLPEDHDFRGFLGMTRTHLWLGAGKLGVGGSRYLVRYRVE